MYDICICPEEWSKVVIVTGNKKGINTTQRYKAITIMVVIGKKSLIFSLNIFYFKHFHTNIIILHTIIGYIIYNAEKV
jgi:hypothetical protein